MTNIEAIEVLKKNRPSWGTREYDKELCIAVDIGINALYALSSLDHLLRRCADDLEGRRKGTWSDDGSHWTCSECGYKLVGTPKKYCPNCGNYNFEMITAKGTIFENTKDDEI